MKPRARVARKSEATKEKIISRAAELFASKGYDGTSIRDLAGACEVNVTSIYHYFGSKDRLWQQIQVRSVAGLPKLLAAAIDEEHDPVERLRVLIRTHLRELVSYQREAQIIFFAKGVPSAHDGYVLEVHRQIMDVYLRELTRLQKLNRLAPGHLKVSAFSVFGVINWTLLWYRRDGGLPEQTVHDELVEFVLRGLGVDSRVGARDAASPRPHRQKRS